MSEISTTQDDFKDIQDIVSEFFEGPVKIIELRKNYVLFQPLYILKLTDEYRVLNLTSMSWFSFQNVKLVGSIDIAFELCAKFTEFEDIIFHNFISEGIQYYNDCNIIIGSNYHIYTNNTHICIVQTDENKLINQFPKKSVTVYDILDHPVLQPYRINHSKPVNRTVID